MSTAVGIWGSVLVHGEIAFLSGVILRIVSLIRAGRGAPGSTAGVFCWGAPLCKAVCAVSGGFCCCELNPGGGS